MKPMEDTMGKYTLINDDPEAKILTKSTRGRIMLTKAVFHRLINNKQIIVPIGFITNGASVPKLLRGIYSQQGKYLVPAIIHDYLYENNLYTREFADRQFLIDMGRTNTNKFTKWLFYYIVRIFGGLNWNKYKK